MSRLTLRRLPAVAGVIVASALAAPAAHATLFSSTELSYDNALLSQFNLVTLNNLTQTTSTTIGGRVIVGGNATFTGSPTVCTVNCSSNSTKAIDASGTKFGALTVFGNLVTPGTNSTTANLGVGGGDVAVKGTSSGNVLMNTTSGATGSFLINGSAQSSTNISNATAIKTTQTTFAGGSYTSNGTYVTGYGVTAQTKQSLASVFPFASSYQSTVKTLSTGLAALPGSPGVNAQALPSGNGIFFTANNDYVAAGKKYGVVTTTLANLASETGFKGIDNGTNDATIVIVTGDGANYTLPSLASYAGASKVIFDFVDATTLNFGGSWSGTILAPLATINMSGTGSFDGSVVVASINQSLALTATNLFTGDLSGLVPEPASLALFGAGLAALGLARRRRK